MDIAQHLQSKKFKNLLVAVLVTLLAFIIFWTGVEVGYNKAAFSYGFGDNYYRIFDPGNMHHGMGLIPNDAVSGSHGVSGKIVSIQLPKLFVADKDNTEKLVELNSDTVIRGFHQTILPTSLKTGDIIVVLGEPDNAESAIDASFVRVMSTSSAPPSGQPAPAADSTGN